MELLDEFIDERRPTRIPLSKDEESDETKSLHGTVSELEMDLAHIEEALALARSQGDWKNIGVGMESASVRREILERIKSRCFRYLVNTEVALRLSVDAARLFESHRQDVDLLLRRVAPDVLDKLASAVRRTGEGDIEARSQALMSCRRVIEAVADLLFPAQGEPLIGSDGNPHAVGQGNYRNRIEAFLRSIPHQTAAAVIQSNLDDLLNRIERLDTLTQKGVHDELTIEEARFGVVQTYLVAGEILSAFRASETE